MKIQTLKEWAKEQLKIIAKEWPYLTVLRTKADAERISKRMRPINYKSEKAIVISLITSLKQN